MSSSTKQLTLFWLDGKSQRGLSLLEIVIALAVVFLALLGFAGFSVVAHTGMSASEKMTRGVTLAQEKMEDVKREGVPLHLISPLRTTESYGSIAGALQHQRVLTIIPNDPMPGLHTITVTVQWDDGTHSTALTSYLTTD